MTEMTLDHAVGVLVSAAQARKDQWKGVSEGKSPDALIDELWESTGEDLSGAKYLAVLIGEAIEVVNKARPIDEH